MKGCLIQICVLYYPKCVTYTDGYECSTFIEEIFYQKFTRAEENTYARSYIRERHLGKFQVRWRRLGPIFIAVIGKRLEQIGPSNPTDVLMCQLGRQIWPAFYLRKTQARRDGDELVVARSPSKFCISWPVDLKTALLKKKSLQT